MPERVELVGGPLDGHVITAPPGRYAWVAGVAKLRRERVGTILARIRWREGAGATSEPGDGRALYAVGDGSAVYAGHREYLCDGCGAYHPKLEGGSERVSCPLGATKR